MGRRTWGAEGEAHQIWGKTDGEMDVGAEGKLTRFGGSRQRKCVLGGRRRQGPWPAGSESMARVRPAAGGGTWSPEAGCGGRRRQVWSAEVGCGGRQRQVRRSAEAVPAHSKISTHTEQMFD